VHRDLKPENFVLSDSTASAVLKLIDFGVALQLSDDAVVRDVVGSPYYIAPDVLDEKTPKTGRSWQAADMWSLGIISYLLVCGYPPFNGETEADIFRAIRKAAWTFPKDHALSAAARDFIERLLVKDPAKRMTAAQALAHVWITDASAASDRYRRGTSPRGWQRWRVFQPWS
jgi:calcium-dependent protein kinase